MKKATLFAVIGFAIMLLIYLYYFIISCINAFDDYAYGHSVLYWILSLLRLAAISGVWYFFFTLYKKQSK